METEAEVGVMQLQAKDCREPPEVRKRQGRSLPKSLQGSVDGPADIFIALLASRTMRIQSSIVLSHPSLRSFVTAALVVS